MKFKIILFAFFIVFLSQYSFAYSNQSIQSKILLDKAFLAIQKMNDSGIPIDRVMDIYSNAKDLYDSNIELEKKGIVKDYNLSNEYCMKIIYLKNLAIDVKDKLKVFNKSYNKVKKKYNLSSMDEEYNNLFKTFNQQRFEDVDKLIEKAYITMSNIEASQTALNIFYSSTTGRIKLFFKNNWKSLLISLVVLIILFIIFKKQIKKFLLKSKLKNLIKKKNSLYNLIKKAQRDYFQKGILSEFDYRVKVNTFKELILDLDRQIPLVREELEKVGK